MRGRPAALIGAASLVAAQSSAQAPDVRVRLDAIVSLRSDGTGPASLRFYDPLGHRGVLAVTFFLEPGFRTYVTQKLQQIENDSDQEPLEEYYVEDEGLWKVGKQFLPFGSGQILRESVLAARGDTNLILEGLPVVFAACDGGPGKQRGYVGRIGSRIGLSFALGHHFGIASTALTYVRAPEDAPGLRRGYERVLGFDAYRNIGSVTVRGEAVFLRSGETARDVDEDILDASLSFRPIPSAQLGVGVTRSVAQEKTFVRLTASVVLDHHTTVEPLIRFADGRFQDAALSFRLRF